MNLKRFDVNSHLLYASAIYGRNCYESFLPYKQSRITSLSKRAIAKTFCFIMDCYETLEKLWQFSPFLLQKGLEVGNGSKFTYGNIDHIAENGEKLFL